MLKSIKNIKPIYRLIVWMQSPVKLSLKLRFFPSLIASIAALPFGRRYINYLGNRLDFDNVAAPLNVMPYPRDIGIDLLKHMGKEPRYVLDVGGNIGQFSITLSNLVKEVSIDIFEPNPVVFNKLKANVGRLKNKIKAYNFALSPSKKKLKFYYEEGRSATGSFLIENASQDTSKVKAISVESTNDPASITHRKNYDLVKIDVEGYEIDVLKTMRNIKTRYLFIEISSQYRSRNYSDSEILSEIEKTFGSYNILFLTQMKNNSPIYEALLYFPDIKRKSR